VSQLEASGSTVCFLLTNLFCLHLLSKVFSIRSIGFLLRATQAGMKTSTKQTELKSLDQPKAVYAASGGNTLQQVAKFKYLKVVQYLRVTWGGARRSLHGLVKQTQFSVSFYRSVMTKRELSNTAKLAVFKSVFVPILRYGHESWVMGERILSQVQAAEMAFMRKVHGVTLRDKLRSCEVRRAMNVEPLLRIERSQLHWFGHVSRMSQQTLVRQVLPATPTERRPRSWPRTRWSDYISDLAGFRHLMWSQQNYRKLLKTVKYFEST